MRFSYRESIAMHEKLFVLEAVFELQKGSKEDILAKMKDLAARRREKQPLEYPSAGSTFKRPEGHFAGKLIEDAGLKGFSVGGAKVSEKHAGFVINTGNATAADVVTLTDEIRRKVKEKYQVELELEVRKLGF
jgi:UDP-N-acetylmuramate dehydrogenase